MAPGGNGQSQEAGQAAEIVSEAVQTWLSEVQRYYDWSQDPDNTWDPEEIVDHLGHTAMEVLPLISRSIDFGLELLRPWSVAFQERANG